MEDFFCTDSKDYTGSLFVFYIVKSLKRGLDDESTFHNDRLENIKSLWKKRTVEILWMACSGKYESMEETIR